MRMWVWMIVVLVVGVGGCGERNAVVLGDGGGSSGTNSGSGVPSGDGSPWTAGDPGTNAPSSACSITGPGNVRVDGFDHPIVVPLSVASLGGGPQSLSVHLRYQAADGGLHALDIKVEAPAGGLTHPVSIDLAKLAPGWRYTVTSTTPDATAGIIVNGSGVPPADGTGLVPPKGRILLLTPTPGFVFLCLEGARILGSTYEVHHAGLVYKN
jgi:hypothetical protein